MLLLLSLSFAAVFVCFWARLCSCFSVLSYYATVFHSTPPSCRLFSFLSASAPLRAQKGEIAGVGPKSIAMMKEFLETGKMGKLVGGWMGADFIFSFSARVWYKRPLPYLRHKNIGVSCVDIPCVYDYYLDCGCQIPYIDMPP